MGCLLMKCEQPQFSFCGLRDFKYAANAGCTQVCDFLCSNSCKNKSVYQDCIASHDLMVLSRALKAGLMLSSQLFQDELDKKSFFLPASASLLFTDPGNLHRTWQPDTNSVPERRPFKSLSALTLCCSQTSP